MPERSVAAIDTAIQVATWYCPAQTRRSDRRGSASTARAYVPIRQLLSSMSRSFGKSASSSATKA